jgi:tetratricopeptide (TPR) repeat protein
MATPGDVRALGEAFKKLGIDEGFVDFVERTLAPRATDAGAWLELAKVLRQRGAYQAALRTYDAAERRFPALHQLPNNRGILLREGGLIEDALKAFQQAVRLRPDYVVGLENQGNALELLGRFAEAEPLYRRILELEPGRATSWNNLGNCAEQLGRHPEAIRCYERAIENDPSYLIALVNLAGVVDASGDRTRARSLVERALKIDPADETAVALHCRIARQVPARPLGAPAWEAPTTLRRIVEADSLHDDVERKHADSRILSGLLGRSKALNDRAGFMAWDRQRLAADPVGDPGPDVVRLTPPTPSSPRLFLAYAWSPDDQSAVAHGYEQDTLMEAFAGSLFNRGYQIVYDRDPRNVEKALDEIHVLRRLYDCNFFVPVVTERYLAKIDPTSPTRGMVGAEWDLACQLADAGFLAFHGVWLSGAELPPRLDARNTLDLRDGHIFDASVEEAFPPGRGSWGVPKLPAPQRPKEPADWPVYLPAAKGPKRRRRRG